MFQHILLAAEDLGHARNAAKMAGETARLMKSSSLCITVTYHPVPTFLGELSYEEETATRQSKAEAVVNSLLKEVGAIPGEIQTEVLEGPAEDAILKVAQVRGSDLILMGNGHREILAQEVPWHHGQKVMNRAPCPVMVVR